MLPEPTGPTNVRPGRSMLVLRLRSVANRIRSWLYFALRARWVVRKGMTRIPWSVDLWSPNHAIELGDQVQFGSGTIVHCDARFGDKIVIARNVAFIGRDDHRHDIVGRAIWDSPRGDNAQVIVEDDVWIGHGAIIVSGVTIGRGSVVAAGSVVTSDIPRYSIAAGVPARAVKQRFTREQIAQHERLLRYPELTNCQLPGKISDHGLNDKR